MFLVKGKKCVPEKFQKELFFNFILGLYLWQKVSSPASLICLSVASVVVRPRPTGLLLVPNALLVVHVRLERQKKPHDFNLHISFALSFLAT